MRIREARADDVDAIVAFTTGTFRWGDYVPDAVEGWIASDRGILHVATDEDDRPIAMMRAEFLTDREVWSHAARVHPAHRGIRIAARLMDAQTTWARERGGWVMRLLIEDENQSAIAHVMRYGFVRAASVIRATRAVGAASPNPEGNGGRSFPSSLTARPGKVHDLPLVRSSWEVSPTGRALRQLIGEGWRFHRLRDADIEAAARSSNLWEVGNSWVITGSIEPVFEVRAIDTTPEEAEEVLRALIDTANNRGAEMFAAWIPDLDWIIRAARRTGCDVAGNGVWALPL